jgi:hypothetical protein
LNVSRRQDGEGFVCTSPELRYEIIHDAFVTLRRPLRSAGFFLRDPFLEPAFDGRHLNHGFPDLFEDVVDDCSDLVFDHFPGSQFLMDSLSFQRRYQGFVAVNMLRGAQMELAIQTSPAGVPVL